METTLIHNEFFSHPNKGFGIEMNSVSILCIFQTKEFQRFRIPIHKILILYNFNSDFVLTKHTLCIFVSPKTSRTKDIVDRILEFRV